MRMKEFGLKEWLEFGLLILILIFLAVLISKVNFYIDRAEDISDDCGWEGEAIKCLCDKGFYDFYTTGDVEHLDFSNIIIEESGYNS